MNINDFYAQEGEKPLDNLVTDGGFCGIFRTIGCVGDSLSSDILGGKNAGIKTCWFNPKKIPLTGDVIPDYEISELSEFLEILKA